MKRHSGRYLKPFIILLIPMIISIIIIGCIDYEPEPYSFRRESIPSKCPDIRVLLATADAVSITTSTGVRSVSSENKDISARFPTPAVNWKIELKNNQWIINNQPVNTFSSDLRFAAARPEDIARLSITDNNTLKLDGNYRGDIQLIARPYGKIAIVNVVKLEHYLNSVVGSEVYAQWHNNALRAQAVAARSYAIWRMNENYRKLWDIGSDQNSQCYCGISCEHQRISQAVTDTAGLVLTYPSASGQAIILPAFYSAVCGGTTESGGPTFNYGLEQLPEKICPYCKISAPANQYRWPETSMSREYVNSKLATKFGLTDIARIVATETNTYGRIRYLNLIDKSGKTARIKAEEFRLTLHSDQTKIMSTWFEIVENKNKTGWILTNGKGWGHGVGMCQRGAQQMAQEGANEIKILSFYYPKAMLKKAY